MKKILLSAILGFACAAPAADSTTSSTMQFSKEEAYVAPQGFLPFIALGGGYTGYDSNAAAEGTPSTVKLLGSWYFDNPIVLDLGYGVNNQQFTQNAAETKAITDGSLELAIRYATENRWQVGVIGNQLYNQGRYYSASQGDAHFVGLQLLKEFNMTPAWLARVGARAQNLTNGTDGTVNMYMIDLQFGWNPQGYKASVSSASNEDMMDDMAFEPTAEPARPVAMRAPASALRSVNMNSIAGVDSSIHFGVSQYALTTNDQRRIEKIARALKDNPGVVEKVQINGFADATGSASINDKISLARANSVKSIFEKYGYTDVTTSGMGTAQSDGLSQADRRAELVFIGVKNEAELRRILSEIE